MAEGTMAGIAIGGVITVVNAVIAYLVARDKARFDIEKAQLQWQVNDLKAEGEKCEKRAAELEKRAAESEKKTAAMQMEINQLKAKS